MEDIKKLFDVLKNSIEKFNEFIATWTKLLKIAKLNKFPDEMRKFRSDMSSYHLGVFLWCRDEYPNISEIFFSLDIFPPFSLLKGLKRLLMNILNLLKKSNYTIHFCLKKNTMKQETCFLTKK